ncbi:2-isopropylmalate synthase [Hippea sp. KM1]|uniref:2-isopropylmalate synthase n=1 Tax=Hippea sp. KM1 TaxID=944481 RepID=UPI00046D1DC4|nr:2-isopropylmalate synthase [Hippea sp. KM1]
MSRKIIIFDTTLRDGEQSPGASMNIHEKVAIAKQLEKLGVDVIEAGFAAASPGDMEAISEVSKSLEKPIIASLARAVKKDIEAAAEALKDAKRKRIHTFIATSPIHVEKKLGMSYEAVKEAAIDAVKYARNFADDVEFSAEDATRSDWDYLCEIFEEVIKAGASTINIPDTVGYTTPQEYYDLISYILNKVPNIDKAVVSVHCHNDLGMAVANSLSAVLAGANQVECTINGIGERAGNAALEEIVMALKVRADFYKDCYTDVNTREIYTTSRLVSKLTGLKVQRNKAVVGKNAFAHEAGIHQDGVIKEKSTYEIMKPEDVGIDTSKLVLGKHSGRHGLEERLKELGYSLNKEQIDELFVEFKKLADKKKEIYDEDLIALVEDKFKLTPQVYELVSLQVVAGNAASPTATLKLVKNGEEFEDAALGDGPVDATFKALERITYVKGRLISYDIQALTEGKDAIGEVVVKVYFPSIDTTIIGRGTSTDIIEASAKAYLDAINKALMRM